MKKIIISILLFVLPKITFGDQIYGSLRIQDAPVRGAIIYITIGDERYTAKTDADGAYRIYVRGNGKANLTVNYNNKVGSFIVISYSEPVRYDFELVENHTNLSTYILIRK